MKAAFLLNFARFVDWPAAASSDTLRIGVVGHDPVAEALIRVGASRPGGAVQVRHGLSATDRLNRFHILFIGTAQQRQLTDVLANVDGQPVLTVSDINGFAEAGGVIGFVQRRNKIRFQINPTVATRAQLTLSAKLLRLAELVQPEANP